MPKYPSDLKYGPYSPACDWGSRVSDLVFVNWTLGLDGGWLPLPTRPQQYCDFSLFLVCLSVCVCVGGWGVDGGWTPLPTRLQQYFGKMAKY